MYQLIIRASLKLYHGDSETAFAIPHTAECNLLNTDWVGVLSMLESVNF